MSDKKHLATISILVKDRQNHATEINHVLTENGHLILARLGVNVQRHCIENCTAIITVVIEATNEEIQNLTKKFDDLYGVVAKTNILTK